MTEVEISIGKSKYRIACLEEEEDRLVEIAARLNERVNKMSISLRNVDEKTLLVIAALTIEEELQGVISDTSSPSDTSEISECDIYDAVSENMENMSDYLEKLTKKVRDY